MTDNEYDVVVVGGGAAGLSGALALSRARRRVLVVDAGDPRNAPADGVHNYLGREGTPPGELLAAGRAEVGGYGGEIAAGTVTAATPDGDGFRVELADGRTVHSRRLLVTTGLVDELPDVPGLAERWGHTVLHCPYCHGWEVRDQPVGVLATGPMAVHQALLWTQWTDDVTFFVHTGPPPAGADRARLAVLGVRFVEGEVVGIEGSPGSADVRLADGTLVPRRALVVTPRFTARSALLEGLGLRPVELGPGLGSRIPAEPDGATAVPGVWVAGNVTDPMAQVVAAAAAGLTAGARINAELVEATAAERLARADSAAAGR